MSGRARASTRRQRRIAPLLLAVYVAAGLLAPLAHLARHRDDHTHGPAGRPSAAGRAFLAVTSEPPVRGHARHRDLAAALRGHDQPRWPWSTWNDDTAPSGTPAADAPVAEAHQHAAGTPAHSHAAATPSTPHEHAPAGDPASPAPGGHAAGSAAHFALAIVDAPAAPVLPLPEDSRTDAPAPLVLRPHAPASRPVLVRGPPVLA